MTDDYTRPRPGDTVVLSEIPLGLPERLPLEDQQAIAEVVGKPLRLNEYDELGRAQLEFTDSNGVIHFIWVNPRFLATPK